MGCYSCTGCNTAVWVGAAVILSEVSGCSVTVDIHMCMQATHLRSIWIRTMNVQLALLVPAI